MKSVLKVLRESVKTWNLLVPGVLAVLSLFTGLSTNLKLFACGASLLLLVLLLLFNMALRLTDLEKNLEILSVDYVPVSKVVMHEAGNDKASLIVEAKNFSVGQLVGLHVYDDGVYLNIALLEVREGADPGYYRCEYLSAIVPDAYEKYTRERVWTDRLNVSGRLAVADHVSAERA